MTLRVLKGVPDEFGCVEYEERGVKSRGEFIGECIVDFMSRAWALVLICAIVWVWGAVIGYEAGLDEGYTKAYHKFANGLVDE